MHSQETRGKGYTPIPSTSSILHPIISPQIQERYQQVPDLVPDYHKPLGWSGMGACVLQGEAEGLGLVWSGEEMTLGDHSSSVSGPTKIFQDKDRHFRTVYHGRKRDS